MNFDIFFNGVKMTFDNMGFEFHKVKENFVEERIIQIQSKISQRQGIRTDAHYKVGKGCLFVREGHSLHRNNVIYFIDENTLFNPLGRVSSFND